MDEIMIKNEYNYYPDIIVFDDKNPIVRSPYASNDLIFYQTKETLMDIDNFRSFLKNAESRFRACKEYKAYKSYLMEMGIDRCQVFGNVTAEDADIELHHNALGLFDICLLITFHTVNVIGMISSFDLVQLLIQEHYANRVGITFLSRTAHQLFTADYDAYIPPEMTFGRWWELLDRYKYGITYDIAYKVVNYLKKYQDKFPSSLNIMQQEEILGFAHFNEYGMDAASCGPLPNYQEFEESGGYFNGY